MHISVNNAPLYCAELGNPAATPVVFVHGFPFNLEMWDAQMKLIAPSFRALAYDVRGHGRSFVGDGQYSIEGHVDDLIALLDHWKIDRTIIVGLSMGGYITLRALERNPERFMAAVLCDTRSEADTNAGKIRRANSAAGVKTTGSAAFAEEFVKGVFAPESFTRRPEVVARIRDIISHTPPLSIAGTQLALASRTDTTDSLQKIKIPVLLLVGELDTITPPAASTAMQGKISSSELFIIPSAAHMSNLENPEFFNEKLLGFLKRVASRSDQ